LTGVSQQRVATRAAVSRAGDQCCRGGPGHQRASSKRRHRPGLSTPRPPARPLPPESPRASLGRAQRKEWVMVPAKPFQLGHPWCNCSPLSAATEPSPLVQALFSFRCSQGSRSSRKILGSFRGKEGWMWFLPPSGPERTMDIGPSRKRCASSRSARSITAWVLHPCLMARPASETTHEAENQAVSLPWRCCLPPWSSSRHGSSGSDLHGHTSTVSLPASTQPPVQQAMELQAAKIQHRGFGAGAHHFLRFSQAERATMAMGQALANQSSPCGPADPAGIWLWLSAKT